MLAFDCTRYLPSVLLRHLHPTHWSWWKNEASFCALRGPVCAIDEDRIWQTQFPRCCTQNMELLTATSPFANHQPTTVLQDFKSGHKTHLFKRAYIWLLPPRTIEEWTYLLTYLKSLKYKFDQISRFSVAQHGRNLRGAGHMRVIALPRVAAWQCGGRESNPAICWLQV